MDIMRYLSDYKIKIYPSRYSALSAVAYGQVDAVMVDMISGNFIVNKFYQNSIQLLKPLYIDTAGFAFALNPKERRLKRIMDIALGRSSMASERKWPNAGMGAVSPSVPAGST